MKSFSTLLLDGLLSVASACSSLAGESEVMAVEVRAESAGTFSFAVTLRHADTGWDHYADRWEVLTMDGEILATRTLFHPHVNEQPFTRSLSGVAVPAGTSSVRVRSHDSVHEYGGPELVVNLKTGDVMPWTGGPS
jgi:hypothetical protein